MPAQERLYAHQACGLQQLVIEIKCRAGEEVGHIVAEGTPMENVKEKKEPNYTLSFKSIKRCIGDLNFWKMQLAR
ncbi:MAG: hypothetical protein JWR72_3972 [Flavisolibacter sp.]|jgi:hypothetical protein|nr:hypothetical protein [Flavisolibacter sp.]